ncbi:unnamed protein product, partial [Ilex paraguariensis]
SLFDVFNEEGVRNDGDTGVRHFVIIKEINDEDLNGLEESQVTIVCSTRKNKQPYLLEYVEKERIGIERDSAIVGGDIERKELGLKETVQQLGGDIENERVGAETDNETSNGSDFHDNEYDVEEDDKMFETYVDMDVEWAGCD